MNLFATTGPARRASRPRAFSWRGGAAARFLAGVAVLALCAAPATAASLTYDADTTAPATDGSGVWNTTAVNWYNGSTDQTWSNGLTDTAIFGVGGTIANAAAGTVTVGTVNVGTIQFSPTVTTGYTLTGGTITLGTGITNTGLSATIGSVIAGSSGLAFTGVAGSTVSTTLSGANTYTGITTASTGSRLASGNATGFGSNVGATASALGTNYTQSNSGATVLVNNSTSEAFLINGGGSNTSGGLRLANNVTLNSLVQLGSDSSINGPFSSGANIAGNVDLASHLLSWSSNGSNSLSGTISGLVTNTGPTVTSGINVGAGGVLNLTNTSNAYTGTTTVSGTLGLGGDTVLGSSTLALGGTVQSTNATARTIANVFTTGNTVFGAASVNTGTLTFTNTTLTSLGAATSKTFTTNVNTTFNTPFSSGGAAATLTKLGAATLTLTGASTYSTQTIVSAGTLAVNNTTGSGTGTSAVSIASGATLTGTGSAAGAVTDSGFINPGAVGAVGALVTGAETYNTGSTLVFDFGNNTIDALTSSGIVTGLNNATLTFTQVTGSTGLTQPIYTLISAASFASGTTLPTSATTPAGYQLQFSPDGNALQLAQIAAAPEPSQWLALGLGALGVGGLALKARRRTAQDTMTA